MDELEIKGRKYISSKRASELTGYAKDYIGQLARAGKIPGTRVGRAWYVEEKTLLSLTGSEKTEETKEAKAISATIVSPFYQKPISPGTLQALGYIPKPLPDTWIEARYSIDDGILLPEPYKLEIALKNDVLQEPVLPQPQEIETKLRIKILEQRIHMAPVQTVPKTSEKARVISAKRKRRWNPGNAISLGALAASMAVFVFFVSGFFLSSDIKINTANSASTANVLAGFEYISDVLKHYPGFADGWNYFKVFVSILELSFLNFFSLGIRFLESIFNLLF